MPRVRNPAARGPCQHQRRGVPSDTSRRDRSQLGGRVDGAQTRRRTPRAIPEVRMTRQPLRDLGVRPVINAAATLTRLGGSRMPPPVLDAMRAGAESFVDLVELQRRVGGRIAELTRNEACYVSSGA